jgi:ribosomal protein S18 acetylase RimI-like enzyme
MTVSVRQVERGDANALAVVHVSAWLVGYRGVVSDEFLDGITVEKWEARWVDWLSGHELPPVTVAVRDGTVVGFCTVAAPSRDQDTNGEVAEVVALNVGADAWRSGVGTALMEDALDRFRRDGWRAVSLWVADGNERAQGFYKTLGFEFDGSSEMHKESDTRMVRMRLPLTDATRERGPAKRLF